MTDQIDIRIRSWVRGTDAEIRTGLLGYLSVLYGDLVIDGLVLRRTAAGRLTLSYPSRSDRAGRRHFVVRPDGDEARRRIERAVFSQATVAEAVEP